MAKGKRQSLIEEEWGLRERGLTSGRVWGCTRVNEWSDLPFIGSGIGMGLLLDG